MQYILSKLPNIHNSCLIDAAVNWLSLCHPDIRKQILNKLDNVIIHDVIIRLIELTNDDQTSIKERLYIAEYANEIIKSILGFEPNSFLELINIFGPKAIDILSQFSCNDQDNVNKIEVVNLGGAHFITRVTIDNIIYIIDDIDYANPGDYYFNSEQRSVLCCPINDLDFTRGKLEIISRKTTNIY